MKTPFPIILRNVGYVSHGVFHLTLIFFNFYKNGSAGHYLYSIKTLKTLQPTNNTPGVKKYRETG